MHEFTLFSSQRLCKFMHKFMHGKFMHSLPSSPGKDFVHLWKRGILSITRDLEVWYILDEVGRLIESHPKLLGTLVVSAQDAGKACQLWRQATVDKSSGRNFESHPLDLGAQSSSVSLG